MQKISNAEYHKIPMLSHSVLKEARKNVYVAYKNSAFCPAYVAPKPTDQMAFGNLYHALIHNQEVVNKCSEYMTAWETLYKKYKKLKETNNKAEMPVLSIKYDEGLIHITNWGLTRANKAYDSIIVKLSPADTDLVVTSDEFQQACELVRALTMHPTYNSLHANAELLGDEVAIFEELDGYKYKCKIDRILKVGDKYIAIDWKSTKENDLSAIQRIGQKMGYDMQSELYCALIAKHFNVPKSNVSMIFVFQCKEYPLIVWALKCNHESISKAQLDRETAANDFMERLNRGNREVGFLPIQADIAYFRHYEDALEDYTTII